MYFSLWSDVDLSSAHPLRVDDNWHPTEMYWTTWLLVCTNIWTISILYGVDKVGKTIQNHMPRSWISKPNQLKKKNEWTKWRKHIKTYIWADNCTNTSQSFLKEWLATCISGHWLSRRQIHKNHDKSIKEIISQLRKIDEHEINFHCLACGYLNISSKSFHGCPLILHQCFNSSFFYNQWQYYHLHKLDITRLRSM